VKLSKEWQPTHNIALSSCSDNNRFALAVNSARWYGVTPLIEGRFSRPPAVRLDGVACEPRAVTGREITLWQQRDRRESFTRGHARMSRDMSTIRDIELKRLQPEHFAAMTRGLSPRHT
jgi:hypothetical protein